MQSCNTMSRAEFILMHCFWGFVVWLWYVPFVFRCLDLKTEPQSMWILTAIVTASSIAGILADITADRRGENVFFNLAMGYGIYTVLACYRICRTLILCSLWTACALSVLCAFCLLSAQIPTGRNASRVLHRRWMQSALVSQRFLCIALTAVMICCVLRSIPGSSFMKTKIVNTQDSMEEMSLSENIQTISLLDSDKWEKLDTKERLNVLQTVARVERRYLGLPNDLTVKMEDLDDDTKGEYLDSRYEIMISSDSLANDSSWECLDTICHEAYHSYQHRVVEALDSVDEQTAGLRMFRRAKKYAREFDHYDTENFDVYYSQACEKDARDYAEDAVKDYYTKIQEYLNSHQ